MQNYKYLKNMIPFLEQMKKKKIVRYNKGISWQNILILVEITFHFQNNDNMNLEWEKRKKRGNNKMAAHGDGRQFVIR